MQEGEGLSREHVGEGLAWDVGEGLDACKNERVHAIGFNCTISTVLQLIYLNAEHQLSSPKLFAGTTPIMQGCSCGTPTTVDNIRPHADHFGSGTLVSRTVQDSRSGDVSILSAFWSPPALTPWFRTYNGGAGGSLIGNTNPLNLQKH